MPEPSNLFLLKSHVYSFFSGEENRYGSSRTCITYCLHTKAMKFRYFATKNIIKQPETTSRKSVLIYCHL